MATNTTNYSFKKPDESDFYDVQDQNGNWDMADEALKSLDTPTFEDYTGSTPVPAANTAIDGIKSKTKLSALMSNIKAAFKGACLIGHIVNNCVTNNPNLPLSAAQGKVLMDLYTRLNGESFGVNPSYPGFPKIWGHVFTNNGNQYGNAAGDCYYLAISSEGKLLIGTQTNNATTITWRSGEIEAATAQTAVMYYANNNIVIADYKTKKVYFTLNLETNILIADANGWTKKYNLSSLTV